MSWLYSLLYSCSVMSDFLWPHGLQHARLPCPSLSPGVCTNSCPLSQWCHPTISSSVIPSPPTFNLSQHQGLFQWVSSSHQVAKVLSFSFSISPSNEYSGLISFRIDRFDLLCSPRNSQESSPTPQFESINSSVLSLFNGSALTSIHDYWRNHSFDHTIHRGYPKDTVQKLKWLAPNCISSVKTGNGSSTPDFLRSDPSTGPGSWLPILTVVLRLTPIASLHPCCEILHTEEPADFTSCVSSNYVASLRKILVHS